MDYPSRLLPKVNDFIIKNIPADHILVRYTEPNIPVFDVDGDINPSVLSEKLFFSYSSNKIPPSNIDDVKIKVLKDELLIPWPEGTEVVPPKEEEFTYINERGYFLFKIEDINNFTARYPYNQNNIVKTFHFILKIIHKPIYCNYPHFEFVIYNEKFEPLKGGDGQWRKEIIHKIRDKMIRIVKSDIRDYPHLFE